MKKTLSFGLTLAFICCICNLSFAQALRVGIKGGTGFAKLDYTPNSPTDSFDVEYYAGLSYSKMGSFRPTFLLAGVLEYDLSKDFFLSSGLQGSLKFSHAKTDPSLSIFNDFRLRVLYLQLPVNVHYRAGKFFLGAGGYAGLGLVGNWKEERYDDGELVKSASDQVKFGSDPADSNLKRFDAGLRAELGLGLKTIRLSVAYEHGLVNNLNQWMPNEKEIFNSRLLHRSITVAATYYWLAK